MGFWSWLGRRTGVPQTLAPVQTFSAPIMPIDQMFAQMRGAGSGPRVGRLEALSVSQVKRGRDLLCSIATLPLVQYDPGNAVVRNPLLEQFDPDVPNVVHLAATVEDLVFEGIAWWRVLGRGFDQFPVSVLRLDPDTVSVDPPKGRSPSPLPAGSDPREGSVWVDGEEVSGRHIIRFDSPNPAVLHVGGRAIKRAILLDQAAAMYAEDPRALDYFTPADGADRLDDAEVVEFLAGWLNNRRRRATSYLPDSVTYNTVESPTPADLQLVELQRQVALDIACAFGIDPEDLGVSTTSRTYANAVDRRRDKINDVLAPYMRAITDRLSMGDVTRRGYRVAFKLDDYLKSNPTERWAVYGQAKAMGVLTVDEIRAEEGLPPLPAGEPAPAVSPIGETPAEVGAGGLRVAGFDGAAVLGFVSADVTGFAVDRETRVIEGLAVPYGRVGVKHGVRFRFDRGALQFAEPGRVKLLRDHDFAQALGRAVDLKDTPAGLKVRFSVARGPDGDRALELAEDGVLDGLSVGVEFDSAADAVPDPRNRGVLLVRRADLREVSLTAMPAFDDARVTRVAASRTGGTMDPCATCGQQHAPDVACPAPAPHDALAALLGPGPAPPAARQWTAEQLDAAFNAAPRGVLAALLGINTPGAREAAAAARDATETGLSPLRVDPGRPGRLTAVVEPVPYRFDRSGNLRRGSHDFSQDLVAFQRDSDQAAGDRATTFVAAAFDDGTAADSYRRLRTFDVATGDVNELNPTRQRPELYVDQRDFKYLIWDAISKGTLSDVTPFIFPKFSSAAGLVGAHTEGVEPTSGTFVTTSQTVTPTATSGKAKITRDVWDQGGNPQLSGLIWRQIVKGWFEGLEAAAVALLDAASPTQIDLSGTPGLADEQLDQALTDAFVGLQFARGGFTMNNGFAQVDFFKALAKATDSSGRRLYPPIGATNATGTARPKWSALDVNGVEFLPAWALAATGSVPASSYLFDADSVHGWATAPQRLNFDIEVAHIYVGVWGYKATAISDINGVREIVYDPA